MNRAADEADRTWDAVAGVKIETFVAGSGRPLLFLHPGDGLNIGAPYLRKLAAGARVYAASHPGFGLSELPRTFSTVDDLAYFYLDAMEHWRLQDAIVVGVSFGAWLAAEIAVKSTARMAGLVLSDPIGIKVSARETRDVADIFSVSTTEWRNIAFHDPALGERDFTAMAEEDVRAVVRNREAVTLFSWSPYAHDPKLRQRLHRIDVPTLLLRGQSDGIVGDDYVRAFADAIAGATFETIPECGHYPHIERPDVFVERVLRFAAGVPSRLGARSQEASP